MAFVLTVAGLLLGCGNGTATRLAKLYVFDPRLSLTGGCGVSPADPIPDPGCPYVRGRGPQPFVNPCGVATDGHGDIYVASSGRAGKRDGRIDVFDPRGRFVTEVDLPPKISERPCRIDVDIHGRIYIAARPMIVPSTANINIRKHPHATAFRYAILRYTPSSYPPTATTRYGLPIIFALAGEAYGVAVDPGNGHVYAAAAAVPEYSPTGRLLSRGNEAQQRPPGMTGKSAIGFSGRDVAVWGRNHDVFVSSRGVGGGEKLEEEEWVVSVYSEEGRRLIETIRNVGGDATAPYVAIAVDQANGDLYVEDFKRHRVEQFRKDRTSGKYELIGVIEHRGYLRWPEEGADLAVDGSPKSPNYGYLFVTSEVDGHGHVFAFAPKRRR